MAGLRRMTNSDANWLEQAQRLAGQHLAPREEACLRYAIGKYFDDVGNFSAAFDSYRRANELSKTLRPEHNPGQLILAVDAIINSFDKEWVDHARESIRARPDAWCFNRGDAAIRHHSSPSKYSRLSPGGLRRRRAAVFWSAVMSDSAAQNNREIGQGALRDWGDQYLKVLRRNHRTARPEWWIRCRGIFCIWD